MYERFFGFRERPFELTPDPRYLYLSASHKEALSNLSYGISSRKGLTVVTGEVGSGKTTLVRRTLESAGEKMQYVYLRDPKLTPEEFTAFLARELQLPEGATAARWKWVQDLERHLTARWTNGVGTALIIDEAQSLSDALFEELRLLTNLETSTSKLLPLVLVGQPELGERLNDATLRNLKQRIALRCNLRALNLQETAAYINVRIRTAGGQSAAVFTREAVTAIHEASNGLPRAISVLCDNALVTAFAAGTKPVNSLMVAEVCRDFDYRVVVSSDDGPTGDEASGEEPVPAATENTENDSGAGVVRADFAGTRKVSMFGTVGR